MLGTGWWLWWTNPVISANNSLIIYDVKHRVISLSHTDHGYQSWIPLSEIPKDLQDITVSIEDRRFWRHIGVDPVAMLRAAWNNLLSRSINSGASTINQQLVRFLVLNPYSGSRPSWIRKTREILMAVRLNRGWSKDQIIESYLNNMYFGHDAYGINTAAYRYFNKPVSQLSPAEKSMLIGLIANPSAFDPIKFPNQALKRRNYVLKKLVDSKLINYEVYGRSMDEPLPTEVFEFSLQAPHFVDMVRESVKNLVPNNGEPLIVETTFDLDWYKFALDNLERQVDQVGTIHQFHNGAIVVIDNRSNSLLTLVGNTHYFKTDFGGQINMATSQRQPGSALKPFTYALAMEKKLLTAASVIDDTPKSYMTKKGVGFIPNNYDGRYRGTVLAREALASSYNLPAVEVLSLVGIDNFIDFIHQMGISSMNQVDKYDYAVTLGGGEVNLFELTNAYATLAREGVLSPIHFITSITSQSGKVLYGYKPGSPSSVISKEVAYLISNILSDPKARYPTFGGKSPLNTAFDTAVKTGTTTDWRDNWTIGYTPEFTVGVWIGNTDQSNMSQISGVTGAGPVWKTMIESLCENYSCSNFVKPNNIISKTICAWDGLLASPQCAETYREHFVLGTEPVLTSSLTRRMGLNTQVYPEIINPKHNSMFEISSYYRPEIFLEVSHPELIRNISWVVDDKVLLSNRYVPESGNHVVAAKIVLIDGKQLNLSSVSFRVVE